MAFNSTSLRPINHLPSRIVQGLGILFFFLCATNLQALIPEKQSVIRDLARILHSEEIDDFTKRLEAIEEKTGVPISLKILVKKNEYSKAIEYWSSLPSPTQDIPLTVLALVDYSSNPEVVLRFRTSKQDLNNNEVRDSFNLIEESASRTTNPKSSVQILISQLEDEIPFILTRAEGQVKRTQKIETIRKDHRKGKILSWLLPLLLLFGLLALAAALLFLYLRKRALHFPEPQWHPRLGAPFSGGNNALAQPIAKAPQQ